MTSKSVISHLICRRVSDNDELDPGEMTSLIARSKTRREDSNATDTYGCSDTALAVGHSRAYLGRAEYGRPLLNNRNDSQEEPNTEIFTNLVVGDQGCSFYDVCDALCPQDSEDILKRWSTLAQALGSSMEFIKMSRLRLSWEQRNITEICVEMLGNWRSIESKNATLGSLIAILQDKGFNKAAQSLKQKFFREENTLQPQVSNRYCWVWLLLCVFTLSTISIAVTIPLIKSEEAKYKSTVPPAIPYYIPRQLRGRSVVSNNTIFNSLPPDNVLVFERISDQIIIQLVGSKNTQTIYNTLSARSILSNYVTGLSDGTQFESICDIKMPEQSVHWITFSDFQFKWVRTCGSITFISSAVSVNVSLIPETAIVSFIKFNDTLTLKNDASYVIRNIILVVGEMGVGKTTLLAHLGNVIISKSSRIMVVYSDMQTFISKAKHYFFHGLEMQMTIITALADLKCLNKLCTQIVIDNITHGSTNLLLLLDGFDQVFSDDANFALAVLKALKQFRSTYTIVTSSSYLRDELENELLTMSYNVEPLDEESQINLLVKFWNSRNVDLNLPCLMDFANSTVSVLKAKLSESKTDLAGIALHTVLIAEVYESNATTYANKTIILHDCIGVNPATYNLISLSALFKFMVHKKMQNVTKIDKEEKKLMYFHAYRAIKARFSNEIVPKEFQNLPKTIEQIGLLERNDKSNNFKFVHPSFIDYFVSWYLLNCLDKDLCNRMSQEVFLLEDATIINGNMICTFRFDAVSFKEKLIVYFLDSFYKPNSDLAEFLKAKWFNQTLLALAAVHDNYFSLFDMLKKYIDSFNYEQFYMTSVLFSSDWPTLEKIIGYGNFASIKPLSQIFINVCGQDDLIYQNYTLLHLAIARGDLEIFKYLFNTNYIDSWGRYLLHFCVVSLILENNMKYQDSKDSILDRDMIASRLKIADLLLASSPNLLEEYDDKLCTPIWYTDTYEIVMYLLSKGADPLAFCDLAPTILHMAAMTFTSEQFHDVMQRLYEGHFLSPEIINIKHPFYSTLIHLYVEENFVLNKTLMLFKMIGADFSNGGKSLLDTPISAAIANKRSTKAIALLMDYQTTWKEIGRKSVTALTFSAQMNNLESLKLFLSVSPDDIDSIDYKNNATALFSIVKKGWYDNYLDVVKTLLNYKSDPQKTFEESEVTPVLKAVQYGPEDIATLLVNTCRKSCKSDLEGNTLLHYAVGVSNENEYDFCPRSDQNKIVQFLFRNRLVNVNVRNSKNQTALELSLSIDSSYPVLLLPTMYTLIKRGAYLNDTIRFLCLRNAMKCPVAIQNWLPETDYTKYVDILQVNSVTQKDWHGNTLLHVAAKESCVNGVKYLIRQKIDVNILNDEGHTALHYMKPYETLDDRSQQIYNLLKEQGAHD